MVGTPALLKNTIAFLIWQEKNREKVVLNYSHFSLYDYKAHTCALIKNSLF